MQILESIEIKEVIKHSLTKSMSYTQYINLVEELVKNNSTTGTQKTEAFVEYTKLNQKRMKRWDKTLKVSEDAKNTIQKFNGKTTWLVLTESWCGDAAHVIPVINKVAELNEKIDLKLVLRDDNEDLMNAFLTNGGKSIPKLIALDGNLNVIDAFGPKPTVAAELVKEFKKDFGRLTPEFKQDLQVWYNKDKGQSTIEDLVELLKG